MYLQRKLLFPQCKTNPFICCAATIVYNKNKNDLNVYIPIYPLYFGYRLYVEITENNTYTLILDPNIEKLFTNQIEILQQLCFIYLPFKLSSINLLNSSANKMIRDWLHDINEGELLNLMNDYILYIKDRCQDGEQNKLIIDFLNEKHGDYLRLQKDTFMSTFSEKLNRCSDFDNMLKLLEDDDSIIFLKDRINMYMLKSHIKELEKLTSDFLIELNDYVTDKSKLDINMDSLEFEKYLIDNCVDKHKLVHEIIKEINTNCMTYVQLKNKINSIYLNSALYHIHYQVNDYYDTNSPSSIMIYNCLDKLFGNNTLLNQTLKSLNSYRESIVSNQVKEMKQTYEIITNNQTELYMIRLKVLENFIKFHNNSIQNYDPKIVKNMNMVEDIQYKNSKEYLYLNEIAFKLDKLKLNSLSIKECVFNLKSVFNIDYNDNNHKIKKYFSNKLDLFPDNFWNLSKDLLDDLNNVSKTIAYFTGCNDPVQFKASFFQNTDKVLTKANVDIYMHKLETFNIKTPCDLDYTLSIQLEDTQDVSPIHNNQGYIEGIKPYVDSWKKIYKEYNHVTDKLSKTKQIFQEKIKEIVQLDVTDLSRLYSDIKHRTKSDWSSTIEYLSLLDTDNPNKELFCQLHELNNTNGKELTKALIEWNLENIIQTEKEYNIEQYNFITYLVSICYKLIYNNHIENILEKINNEIEEETKQWNNHENLYSNSLENIQIKLNHKGKSLRIKDILNPEIRVVFEKIARVYPKETAHNTCMSVLNRAEHGEFLFFKSEKTNILCPISELVTNPLDCYSELTQLEHLFNRQQDKQKLSKMFTLYLMIYVNELMCYFQSNTNTLMKSIYTEKFKDLISESFSNHCMYHIFHTYPCYILIGLHTETDTVLKTTHKIKYQINILKKLTLPDTYNFTDLSSDNPSKFDKKNDTKTVSTNTESIFLLLTDVFQKYIKQKLKLSFDLFRKIISKDFWNKEFIDNLNQLKNIWSQTSTLFRLKSDYKTSKFSQYLNFSITGITHENREIFLFNESDLGFVDDDDNDDNDDDDNDYRTIIKQYHSKTTDCSNTIKTNNELEISQLLEQLDINKEALESEEHDNSLRSLSIESDDVLEVGNMPKNPYIQSEDESVVVNDSDQFRCNTSSDASIEWDFTNDIPTFQTENGVINDSDLFCLYSDDNVESDTDDLIKNDLYASGNNDKQSLPNNLMKDQDIVEHAIILETNNLSGHRQGIQSIIYLKNHFKNLMLSYKDE